ncbi:MAG: allophanate hydrolase subunit 1 [Pseudomonadota bacterium]
MSPSATRQTPQLRPLGDVSLLVEFGESVDVSVNKRAAAFERQVCDAHIDGILETATTIKAVIVRYNPLTLPLETLTRKLRQLLSSTPALDQSDQTVSSPNTRTWDIPVCYDPACAPDLAEMACALNLTVDDVVRQHCATQQQVFMIGFAPGFLYSGLLPENLHLPRRNTISPAIPPGAVICAVGQTCIAATEMPTGWYEIGRSPLRNFAPDLEPPVTIVAGDRLQFSSITHEELQSLDAARTEGRWRIQQVTP